LILNDFERQYRGFMDFLAIFGLRDISGANCAEFTTDRPRQAACEVFSIERRFQRSKSKPCSL